MFATRRFVSLSSNKIIKPLLPKRLDADGDITYHINPTGRFVVGGPHGDCGLTGRKIIVDTYGGWGRHGGGAFSGKDPTKVDRSAAYMARHVAKNIVAAGLADRCEVQLAYAIGVCEPVSVHVDTQGTGKIDDADLCQLVRELFPLTPAGSSSYLELRRPIFRKTAAWRPLRSQRSRFHLGKHPHGGETSGGRQEFGHRLGDGPLRVLSAESTRSTGIALAAVVGVPLRPWRSDREETPLGAAFLRCLVAHRLPTGCRLVAHPCTLARSPRASSTRGVGGRDPSRQRHVLTRSRESAAERKRG